MDEINYITRVYQNLGVAGDAGYSAKRLFGEKLGAKFTGMGCVSPPEGQDPTRGQEVQLFAQVAVVFEHAAHSGDKAMKARCEAVLNALMSAVEEAYGTDAGAKPCDSKNDVRALQQNKDKNIGVVLDQLNLIGENWSLSQMDKNHKEVLTALRACVTDHMAIQRVRVPKTRALLRGVLRRAARTFKRSNKKSTKNVKNVKEGCQVPTQLTGGNDQNHRPLKQDNGSAYPQNH